MTVLNPKYPRLSSGDTINYIQLCTYSVVIMYHICSFILPDAEIKVQLSICCVYFGIKIEQEVLYFNKY